MKTILATLLLSLAAAAAHAAGESNLDSSGLALKGYDPVAYFTEKKPLKGKVEFTAQHEGATYRFASAANRDAFAAAPQQYAPQYGGYCAFGVAGGYKAPIEPDAWTVADGKSATCARRDAPSAAPGRSPVRLGPAPKQPTAHRKPWRSAPAGRRIPGRS